MTLEQALNLGIENFARAAGHDDFKEGTGAFLDKRKPSFSGD